MKDISNELKKLKTKTYFVLEKAKELQSIVDDLDLEMNVLCAELRSLIGTEE